MLKLKLSWCLQASLTQYKHSALHTSASASCAHHYYINSSTSETIQWKVSHSRTIIAQQQSKPLQTVHSRTIIAQQVKTITNSSFQNHTMLQPPVNNHHYYHIHHTITSYQDTRYQHFHDLIYIRTLNSASINIFTSFVTIPKPSHHLITVHVHSIRTGKKRRYNHR